MPQRGPQARARQQRARNQDDKITQAVTVVTHVRFDSSVFRFVRLLGSFVILPAHGFQFNLHAIYASLQTTP